MALFDVPQMDFFGISIDWIGFAVVIVIVGAILFNLRPKGPNKPKEKVKEEKSGGGSGSSGGGFFKGMIDKLRKKEKEEEAAAEQTDAIAVVTDREISEELNRREQAFENLVQEDSAIVLWWKDQHEIIEKLLHTPQEKREPLFSRLKYLTKQRLIRTTQQLQHLIELFSYLEKSELFTERLYCEEENEEENINRFISQEIQTTENILRANEIMTDGLKEELLELHKKGFPLENIKNKIINSNKDISAHLKKLTFLAKLEEHLEEKKILISALKAREAGVIKEIESLNSKTKTIKNAISQAINDNLEYIRGNIFNINSGNKNLLIFILKANSLINNYHKKFISIEETEKDNFKLWEKIIKESREIQKDFEFITPFGGDYKEKYERYRREDNKLLRLLERDFKKVKHLIDFLKRREQSLELSKREILDSINDIKDHNT